KLGEVVTIKAQVTRAFNSSLEVRMEVFAQNLPKGTKEKSNEAYYTFVALNEEGKPKAVPMLIPETEGEKTLYTSALQRRELRLILSGKLKPENAEVLQDLIKLFQRGE
ncbi:acyl-CoA thioesterase, partial [Brucella sp. 21LCYQ03]|nr:acyl-CoA thioesterase [Brucella sp. 21LCYQ03]